MKDEFEKEIKREIRSSQIDSRKYKHPDLSNSSKARANLLKEVLRNYRVARPDIKAQILKENHLSGLNDDEIVNIISQCLEPYNALPNWYKDNIHGRKTIEKLKQELKRRKQLSNTASSKPSKAEGESGG